MWGGRESMTWNYNGDQDDDLADDLKQGEGMVKYEDDDDEFTCSLLAATRMGASAFLYSQWTP